MSLYGRFIRRYSGTRWFSWAAARAAPALDRIVYRLSRGRRLATPTAVPTLLLTSIGRRSGAPHTVPLSFVTFEGAEHVAGTNFGQPHHPAWALNLLTRPEASVEFRGDGWEVNAVRVPESARAHLWELFDELLPAYRAYRDRVVRDIHMFRLERV